MKHKKINLDADTGQIVSDEFAAANKEKVVAVRRMNKLTKLFDEARMGNDISQKFHKLSAKEQREMSDIAEIIFVLVNERL